MSADIIDLVRPSPVYTAILIRDDVSLGDLMHALRFSGIVVSTDPDSGQTYIHRPNPPQTAA